MDTEVPVYLIRGVWACYIGGQNMLRSFSFPFGDRRPSIHQQRASHGWQVSRRITHHCGNAFSLARGKDLSAYLIT